MPPAHQAIYEDEYLLNRNARTGMSRLVAGLEGWMHRKVAASGGFPLLELGAGTLNHVPFEPPGGTYDAVEPFDALCDSAAPSRRARIGTLYSDIAEVPQSCGYARIASVAVLEHLEDLPGIVIECARRLAEGGTFVAGIPSEGGALWGAGWRCSTALSFRLRRGLPYAPIMRHEHVNTAAEIEEVLQGIFENVRTARFPLPVRHLSFYTVLQARGPRAAVLSGAQ